MDINQIKQALERYLFKLQVDIDLREELLNHLVNVYKDKVEQLPEDLVTCQDESKFDDTGWEWDV